MSEAELPDIRREKIGFVFQSFNLLESLNATRERDARHDGSPRGGSPHRARELLNMLGLSHRLKSLPKKLERRREAARGDRPGAGQQSRPHPG